jgi:transmembrane sensor
VQRGAVEARAARANPVHLGPGDQLTIERRSGAMQQTRIPPEEVASWRDYRLFVEGASVAEVVEELRRYRSGWIVFADSKLAHRQVTGLYDLRDPDRALRALIGPFGGQVREIAPLLTVVSSP